MANTDSIYDIIEKVGHMYIQEKEISLGKNLVASIAFRKDKSGVLQATESWAGPGNEAEANHR